MSLAVCLAHVSPNSIKEKADYTTYFPGLSRSPPILFWQQFKMYRASPSRLYKLLSTEGADSVAPLRADWISGQQSPTQWL
jgi:hypothetical protein